MTQPTGVSENQSAPIMTRLKKETKSTHERLEVLPYFTALAEHRLPLERYVVQLQALAIVHGVMESEIMACRDGRVAAVWEADLRKLPLLEKDLEFFKPRIVSDFPFALDAAMKMTAQIRLRGIENPVTLLGYLYVFEGSTLGNHMHQPDISKTFHLVDLDGCQYYSSYQDQLRPHWKKFSEKMNQALDDPMLHDAIMESAYEAYDGLDALYKALYAAKPSAAGIHATRINPEAGNHPMPEDEREILAALDASGQGWDEFAYYEFRYGQRGRRFSDSDTCWLTTLANLEQEELNRQVAWIGRVLATRGMPRIMMERTLRFLHDALVRSVPEKTPAWTKLANAAQMLFEERTAHFPKKEFERLAAEFEKRVGPDLAKKHKNTGELLISSVADEKNGMEGAVSAIQSWMTDPGRFPEHWISAVNDTIQKANA
jgi:heme oxygenase